MFSLPNITRAIGAAALLAGLLYLVQLNVSVEAHLWLSVSAFVIVVAFMKTQSSHLQIRE